jgi:hypothetical protein
MPARYKRNSATVAPDFGRGCFTRKEYVMAKNDNAAVIIPSNLDVLPEPHEIEVAWILARHFSCSVQFMKRIDSYKIKTPDIEMLGIQWEMKSPTGNSKTTIRRQFARASKQSKYIVIDSRRSELPETIFENRLRYELSEWRSVKKVILITKAGKVVEIAP